MHSGKIIGTEVLGDGRRLVIECADVARSEAPGASIAINGVCLTATQIRNGTIAFDVVPETLARSDLGAAKPGQPVNVEPSLRVGDPMGGHFVYGHVDAAVAILRRDAEPPGERVWFERPQRLEKMIVEKGFVALDGVSLTVAGIAQDGRAFAVALIPETLKRTTLGSKKIGDRVNLEVDPLARYA